MSQGSALRFCKAGRSLRGRRRFLGWVIANRSKSTIEECLAKKPWTSLNLTIRRSMNMLLGVNLNLDRNERVMLDRITAFLVVSKETAVRVCELAWSVDIVQSRTGGWKRKKERARNSRNPHRGFGGSQVFPGGVCNQSTGFAAQTCVYTAMTKAKTLVTHDLVVATHQQLF